MKILLLFKPFQNIEHRLKDNITKTNINFIKENINNFFIIKKSDLRGKGRERRPRNDDDDEDEVDEFTENIAETNPAARTKARVEGSLEEKKIITSLDNPYMEEKHEYYAYLRENDLPESDLQDGNLWIAMAISRLHIDAICICNFHLYDPKPDFETPKDLYKLIGTFSLFPNLVNNLIILRGIVIIDENDKTKLDIKLVGKDNIRSSFSLFRYFNGYVVTTDKLVPGTEYDKFIAGPVEGDFKTSIYSEEYIISLGTSPEIIASSLNVAGPVSEINVSETGIEIPRLVPHLYINNFDFKDLRNDDITKRYLRRCGCTDMFLDELWRKGDGQLDNQQIDHNYMFVQEYHIEIFHKQIMRVDRLVRDGVTRYSDGTEGIYEYKHGPRPGTTKFIYTRKYYMSSLPFFLKILKILCIRLFSKYEKSINFETKSHIISPGLAELHLYTSMLRMVCKERKSNPETFSRNLSIIREAYSSPSGKTMAISEEYCRCMSIWMSNYINKRSESGYTFTIYNGAGTEYGVLFRYIFSVYFEPHLRDYEITNCEFLLKHCLYVTAFIIMVSKVDSFRDLEKELTSFSTKYRLVSNEIRKNYLIGILLLKNYQITDVNIKNNLSNAGIYIPTNIGTYQEIYNYIKNDTSEFNVPSDYNKLFNIPNSAKIILNLMIYNQTIPLSVIF